MAAVEVALEVEQDLVAAIHLVALRYQAFSVADMPRATVARKKKTINMTSHNVMIRVLFLQVSSDLALVHLTQVLASELQVFVQESSVALIALDWLASKQDPPEAVVLITMGSVAACSIAHRGCWLYWVADPIEEMTD